MTNDPPYTGKLTSMQVVEGINAARRNCRRLANDAALLLAAGSWPTAASLAVLAIEEAGKARLILDELSIAKEPDALKAAWKRFRNHPPKLRQVLRPRLKGGPLRSPGFAHDYLSRLATLVRRFDRSKQSGFYLDCLQDAENRPRWEEPTSAIDEKMARTYVERAAMRAATPDVRLRTVELWVDHVRATPEAGDLAAHRRWFMDWVDWLIASDAAGLLDKPAEDHLEGLRHLLREENRRESA